MTTIMQQYRDAKERHPDMLLLFHVHYDDSYELYGDDADIAAQAPGAFLKQRDGIHVAVIDDFGLEIALRHLLQAGHRVAICEPVTEAPKAAKVERVVTGNASPAW